MLLFALFAGILAMLVWGRFRHDLVAAGGLLLAVVLGLVPQDDAFSGFSNPAVIIVALVLVASRAFENSGALGLITRWAVDGSRGTAAHIGITGGIAAALSAVINNVAALALLMPMDIAAARKAGRPPSVSLMPLAFATILGGMVTLIGTPPNIIASSIREEYLGRPYGMFDFTPVGLAVAVAGVLFVALVGWRLVPKRKDHAAELASSSSFAAELVVAPDSAAVGRLVADFDEDARSSDVLLTGIVRAGRRNRRARPGYAVEPGDFLLVSGSTEAIAAFIKSTGLLEADSPEAAEVQASDVPASEREGKDGEDSEKGDGKEDEKEKRPPPPEVVEVVVRENSPLVGRSTAELGLRDRFAISVLGIGRAGTVWRQEVRRRKIRAGDVLLLAGRGAASEATLDSLGLIPINRVSVAPFKLKNAIIVVGLFMLAIVVASMGWLSFTVAIAIAVAAYAAFGIVPAREFYANIEWPVVVMLACLIPIGSAFDDVGGTALIADWIAAVTADGSAVVALVAVMVVTMMLSDVLNNVATMVITGPVAIDLARRLDANPDTFLMGVAIAASCAFLTPIGHKNNTLIMGPGGYRFSDYWRMGLPLEVVVLVVAVPMLLAVWPL